MTNETCSCNTSEQLTDENERLRQPVQALRKALALVTEANQALAAANSAAMTAQLQANGIVSDAVGLWTWPTIPNN